MRFYLCDRIDEWHAGECAAGSICLPRTLSLWDDGLPDAGVLPVPLLTEALAQLGAWLAMESRGFKGGVLLSFVQSIHAETPARPGQPVRLEVQVVESYPAMTVVTGKATVLGRVALTAGRIALAHAPDATEQVQTALRAQFQQLIGA